MPVTGHRGRRRIVDDQYDLPVTGRERLVHDYVFNGNLYPAHTLDRVSTVHRKVGQDLAALRVPLDHTQGRSLAMQQVTLLGLAKSFLDSPSRDREADAGGETFEPMHEVQCRIRTARSTGSPLPHESATRRHHSLCLP